MIKFIFLMTVLQHLRHANEVTCFMSFEAHLHITQVTFIQEIMFFSGIRLSIRTWECKVMQAEC